MDIQKLLEILFQLVILPIIPLVVLYVKKFIEVKINELQAKTDNVVTDKYLQIAEDGILKAVTYVSQTYVDALKTQGKFGAKEQKIAFDMAKDKFNEIVSDEVQLAIAEMVNDYNSWIQAAIESMVKETK